MMPILRVDELRRMSPKERASKLNELKGELARLRVMMASGGSMENPARVREVRKAIARILTIQREEELKVRPLEKIKKPS